MYLLDTNVVSELRRAKSGKADKHVTALVHGMAVATRNVADFAPTGVELFNPWENG
jgi:predicted nucleic acid-binding protein